ncbi:MAG TPA: hypothetical protein PKI11_13420 [Candidatus Hydrogenedentes bacterium]|nr:hypothetical protein [Candidatus Hydrogenedentota bacterium]
MNVDWAAVAAIEEQLDGALRERIAQAADAVVAAKERGGRVVVVTGSGPNLHEGVTTLLAELMRAGVVDGVATSSAVVAHEMGGALDKVKRCDGAALGVPEHLLPLGGEFELTEMDDAVLREIAADIPVDFELIERLKRATGKTIIKAAGNLGYPVGLWIEHVAREVLEMARRRGASFEEIAGLGADPRTMIGIGVEKGLPVLVTIPQLVGGGAVGLCVGDSLSITERAERLARMLDGANVIIESGLALAQEVHDGPFECFTGHGLWSGWQGGYSYRLEGKTLVRIDLDPALDAVWNAQREGGAVQRAIADGQPKTKLFKVPFRMEMSGFARHPGSIPIVADLGVVWPVIARRIAERLRIDLEFVSYPQQTPEGQAMREWIAREIRPFSHAKMLDAAAAYGEAEFG